MHTQLRHTAALALVAAVLCSCGPTQPGADYQEDPWLTSDRATAKLDFVDVALNPTTVTATESGDEIWVAGRDGSVVYSADRGDTWRREPQAFDGVILSSAFDDRDRQIWFGSSGGKLFHARLPGGPWQTSAGPAAESAIESLIFVGSTRTLIALSAEKIFAKSEGAEWTRVTAATALCGDLKRMAFSSVSKELWVIGVKGDVCHGKLDAAMWIPIADKLSGTASAIAIDPVSGRVAIGGGMGYVALSTDNGKRFSLNQNDRLTLAIGGGTLGPKAERRVGEMSFIPGRSELWTTVVLSLRTYAVYAFKDGTWTHLIRANSPPIFLSRPTFALAFERGGPIAKWSSDNKGLRISSLPSDRVQGLSFFDKHGEKGWYVATDDLYATTNGGLTWRVEDIKVVQPKPKSEDAGNSPLSSIRPGYPIVADADAGEFWTASASEVWHYKSGGTLKRIASISSNEGIDDLKIDIQGKQLFAAVGRKLFTSSDRGIKWRELREFQAPIYQIFVDPQRRTLWVGSDEDDGLYRGADFGESWQKTPLRSKSKEKLGYVHAIAPVSGEAHGGLIFASTESDSPFVHVFRERNGTLESMGPIDGLDVSEGFSAVFVDPAGAVIAANSNATRISYDYGRSWNKNYGFVSLLGGELALTGPAERPILVTRRVSLPGRVVVSRIERLRESSKTSFPLLKTFAPELQHAKGASAIHLGFTEGSLCHVKDLSIQLRFKRTGSSTFEPLDAKSSLVSSANLIRVEYALDERMLRTGDHFSLELVTSCTEDDVSIFTAVYPLPELRVGSIVESVPGGWRTICAIIAFFALPVGVLLIYLVSPAWIIPLRTGSFFQAAETLPAYISWVPKVILGYLLVPILGRRPRVLDAWVRRQVPRFSKILETKSTVRQRNDRYVPLPAHVSLGGSSDLVAEPSPATLSRFVGVSGLRVVIQGAGGTGKTRLGVEIARWCMESSHSKFLGGHLRLPILLDEEIEDIEKTLATKLRAADAFVDADLVKALLESGRLLILADRFSEHSADTGRQILRLTGELNAAAVVLTSRTAVDLEVAEQTNIVMKALDARTLTIFIYSLIADPSNPMDNVILLFATALIQAADTGKETSTKMEVTPLLAKLFVEQLVAQRETGEQETPSIPETFFSYVLRLHASNYAEKPIAELQLRRICVELGKLSLTIDLRPGDFSYDDARRNLTDKGLWSAETDVIDRLIDDTVLQSEYVGTVRTLRFEYDPMAEIFWLYAAAENCGADSNCWAALVQRLSASENGTSLVSSLRAIHQSYAGRQGWKDFPEPQPGEAPRQKPEVPGSGETASEI